MRDDTTTTLVSLADYSPIPGIDPPPAGYYNVLRDVCASLWRTWILQLDRDERVVAAWLVVEVGLDLRYTLALEWCKGAWRPAPRDAGTWIRGATPGALAPLHVQWRSDGEADEPTSRERWSVPIDALLKTWEPLVDALEALDGGELAAVVRRSGFTTPKSRRGGRPPLYPPEQAERLRTAGEQMYADLAREYAEGESDERASWERVASELGCDERTLYRIRAVAREQRVSTRTLQRLGL